MRKIPGAGMRWYPLQSLTQTQGKTVWVRYGSPGKNGEKRKKRGLLLGMNQAKGPAKWENPIKSVQGYPIRSMENTFANPPAKSPKTRMKPKKSGLDI